MNKEQPTVPGEFACPECGFVLTKSVLNPTTGQCGRDVADRLEPCPNDGTILRPVTYAEALAEAREHACQQSAIVNKLPRTADGVPITPGMAVYASGGLELVVWAVRHEMGRRTDGRRPCNISTCLPGNALSAHTDWSHLVWADQAKAVEHEREFIRRAEAETLEDQ